MTLSEDTVYKVSFEKDSIIFGDSKGNLYNVLQELMKSPYKWFKIGDFNAKSSANATISAIAEGKRPIPDGKFLFTARCPSKDSSELYASYVPSLPKLDLEVIEDFLGSTYDMEYKTAKISGDNL